MLGVGLIASAAQAGPYPDRAIHLIVPFSAGGGADNAARIVAQKLGERLGQAVIVENRPSAGGVVAETSVANATPNGYTVLYDSFTLAINAGARKLSIDLRTGLIPVTSTATAPTILVVNDVTPARTFKEFVAYAKANPGKISYASYGIGSVAHLAGELLSEEAGLSMIHVPFKGGGDAITQVAGGAVNSYFAAPTSAQPFLRSNKLRALAVTSSKRLSNLPEVPTMIEEGYADFVMETWHGLFVPRGTSPEIVAILDKETQASLADPQVQKLMRTSGLEPKVSTQPAFAKFVAEQTTRWSQFVKTRKIELE